MLLHALLELRIFSGVEMFPRLRRTRLQAIQPDHFEFDHFIFLKELFQLVAGERRWRAAKAAGIKEAPCFIRDLSDQEALEAQLIENRVHFTYEKHWQRVRESNPCTSLERAVS